jgi:energy-coupling factor transporter ATP-binding protein EcfA2
LGVILPTAAEEIAAAKAAIAIVQLADKQGWLDKLKGIFKTKHKVLILGSTGTGKSNFVDSLQALMPRAIDRLQRTAYASSERVRLAGSIFDFTDTPGQGAHRSRRLDAVVDMLKKSEFGIINVVCWGFHEYMTGQERAVTLDSQPDPVWLEKHRGPEVQAAEEWVPLMTAKPSYTITLVTKADLWWPDRDEVIRYYESGPYYTTIRDAAIKGHAVIPYSSVLHRFYGTSPSSGMFDTQDRAECQERFLKELFMAAARTQLTKADEPDLLSQFIAGL